MPFGFGRGWRWGFMATGMPGWVRPGFGFGWGWNCRWFPWLPRWWWTGMYGPVQWTPQGPVLASQIQSQNIQQAPVTQASVTPQIPFQQVPFKLTKEQEIDMLKQELSALEQEKKAIEDEMKYIKQRLDELSKK